MHINCTMKEVIKTLISEWEDKTLPDTIERSINLEKYLNIKKIIVITGFRRVGKTYLIFNLLKKLLNKKNANKAIYINFEDERIPLKTEFLTDLLPVIKQSRKDIEFLFLDEIQNIPLWSKWLRRVYDNEDIQFFATGSSSKMSSREIPTELRGRFLEVKLFPLSFKEFLLFNKINIQKDTDYNDNKKSELIRLLNEYIDYGGLPEIVLADKAKKEEIVHNYFNTVIRRDLIERFNIKNEEALKALLRLLLNSTNYTISKLYNNLKSLNFEVGKTTVQTYLAHLEDSYFIYSLPIFSYKIKDQLQYDRKIYFIDTSFINLLSAKFSKNKGRLYENAVFIQLKRMANNQEIYYWRTKQKEEVDFVIKEGFKAKQLIQVCYDINDYETKKREIRALIKASKELKCKNLLVITEEKEGEEIFGKNKVNYIPLWKWLLSQ